MISISILRVFTYNASCVFVPAPFKNETMIAPKPQNTKAYTVKQKRSEHGNAYVPWDDEADRLLCRMYDEGKSISLLSDIFERTKDAIRSRLKKLGKIN